MKSGFRLSWAEVGSLGVVACMLGAVTLPSCGGDGFASDDGHASGGEPGATTAGTSSGGLANGAAGDASSLGDAGSDNRGGEGGHPAQGEAGSAPQGEAGSSGGTDAAGAPSTMAGSGGTPQGGSGGAPQGGSGGGGMSPVGVKAFDDFVASAEGWTVTGDDTIKTVKYSSTGGKPNGSISAEEATTGTLFFTAPQKYLGDASAFYGGEIRFDLKAGPTEGAFFEYADVELTSNLVTLAYDCTPNPTTAWQTYVVPLNEKGWKLTTVTGAAVTPAQFKAVLADLTRVRIRGEFSNQVDTGYLDNVYFGAKQ